MVDQGASDISSYTTDRTLTAVEVFSGPGGLGLGLHSAGFNVLAAIEKVGSCVQTYKRNHPHTAVLHKDARNVTNEEILSIIKSSSNSESVTLVAGGPPCETFSTAGPGIRNKRDHRDQLFRELIRIAVTLKAKYILIENIPGLATKKGLKGLKAEVFNEVLDCLREANFTRFRYGILNAVDFGAPQNRTRLFILATSDPDLPLLFPAPTHGVGRAHPINTVENALGDLPPLKNNETREDYLSEPQNEYQTMMRSTALNYGEGFVAHDIEDYQLISEKITLHKAPNHRPRTIERFKMIKQGEGLRDLMVNLDASSLNQLQKKGVLPKSWYIQRDRRLVPGEPSPTVTSHCLDELLHPIQDRHITPREAARLQTFPDWYYFEGPWVIPHMYEEQDKYEQIGDAVPPVLALAMAKSIIRGIRLGKDDSYGEPEEVKQLDFSTLWDFR